MTKKQPRKRKFLTLRIVQSEKNIYLDLPSGEDHEFPNTPEGLVECYQIITRELGLDMGEEEVVLSFRKASRPVWGINHR